jgi:hypothetical protein
LQRGEEVGPRVLAQDRTVVVPSPSHLFFRAALVHGSWKKFNITGVKGRKGEGEGGELNIHFLVVIILGDSSVGKTFLFDRWAKDEAPTNARATVTMDHAYKTFRVKDDFVRIQFWDTGTFFFFFSSLLHSSPQIKKKN